MGKNDKEICYCFLDTNLFLHYQLFTSIDWTNEIGVDNLVLVVCMAVMKELDEKKFSHPSEKVKQRAKDSVSKLIEINKKNEGVNKNIELLIPFDRPEIDWESEGLKPNIIDDEIIAIILHKKQDMKNQILITSDGGLTIKATSKGIHCHKISDKWLVKPEKSTEEKELDELRKFRDGLPKLNLKVKSEQKLDNKVEFVLNEIPPLDTEKINKVLIDTREKLYHSIPSPIGFFIGQLYDVPSEEQIERYKINLEKYLEKLKVFYEESWRYREKISRTIEIYLVLHNEGSSSAEDIDIFLSFPEEFEIYDLEKINDKPEPPNMPTKPISAFQIPKTDANLLRQVAETRQKLLDRDDLQRQQSRPIIIKDNGYKVRFMVEKLKHKMVHNCDPIYLVFPSMQSAKSFHVDYTIHASNIPQPINEKIHFVMRKGK